MHMLKVLIVEKDGEQLERILSFVNWGVYGFEVIGCCSDGITAMEEIVRSLPDLVFIDDDLPRLKGIELIRHIQEHGISCDFVIQSETKSFELAHAAMGLGIEEYLLKPISRDELIRVLKKIAQRHWGIKGQDINEHLLRTRQLLRNSFMDRFTSNTAPEYYSIEYMNQKFHFKFREGIFQSAIIIVKGMPDEENREFLECLIEAVRAKFDPICYEMLPYIQGHYRVSFTFNYSQESGVAEKLPELYTLTRQYLEKCGYKSAVFCVGIGNPENDSTKFRRTLQTAERAVRCGILRGQNKLYSYGELKFDKINSFDILTPTLLDDLKYSAEALKIQEFESTIRAAFSPISYGIDPGIMINLCEAAIDAVVEAVKTEDDINILNERKEILDRLGSETTLAGTISDLVTWANDMFSRKMKENEYVRPVREAMRYIEANCTEPLTLSQVAEQVELNSSYLSSIFKKEVGQGFSDYLARCRINEAKRLLKESNLTIAQICTAVGYTDNKHFSKIFTKTVGLKPSSYRSLHG
jgi:two-component system response regulator YesN